MTKSRDVGKAFHLQTVHVCPRCQRSFRGNIYAKHERVCGVVSATDKRCANCGERKPFSEFFKHRRCLGGYGARCKACERSRQSGKTRQYDPAKRRARTALRIAMLGGKIVQPAACSGCNEAGKKLEAHHTDYAKPLDVKWLCRSCHTQLHRTNLTTPDYYYGGKAL